MNPPDWVQFCRDRRAAESGAITIEQQIEQLNAAGWVAERKTRWRSPAGELFLGPHGAWKAMIAARRQGGAR